MSNHKQIEIAPAPEGLSDEAKAWWNRLAETFAIVDDAGLLLLQTAMEALDRMKGCQTAIDKEGERVVDRFGQSKPHPLLSAERDARAQLLQALKILNLDVDYWKPKRRR